MNDGAFKSAFEVDDNWYAQYVRYDYEQPWLLSIPSLPSLSELVSMLDTNFEKHERTWQFAADGPVPNVKLDVRASYGYIGAIEPITFLVDTGAFTSTLNEETADLLKIDRRQRPGETLGFGRGAGGQRILGFHRWIGVDLAGVWQQIPVLVPPEGHVLNQVGEDGLPLGLPPKSNLLGRAQMLVNYLFCLDPSHLYAFRDIFSPRRRYTS